MPHTSLRLVGGEITGKVYIRVLSFQCQGYYKELDALDMSVLYKLERSILFDCQINEDMLFYR